MPISTTHVETAVPPPPPPLENDAPPPNLGTPPPVIEGTIAAPAPPVTMPPTTAVPPVAATLPPHMAAPPPPAVGAPFDAAAGYPPPEVQGVVPPPPPPPGAVPPPPPPVTQVAPHMVGAPVAAPPLTTIAVPAVPVPAPPPYSMAPVENNAMAEVSNDEALQFLAEQGITGVRVGFGSFDTVKMDNGGDITSANNLPLGRWFTCRIMTSRPKWAVKQANLERPEVVYSHGPSNLSPFNKPSDAEVIGFTTDAGVLIQDVVNKWAAQGIGYKVKEYADLTVTLEASEKDPGGATIRENTVIVQVSPESVSRWGGYVKILAYKRKKVSEVITQVYSGEKIMKVAFPFCPWMFREVQ